MFDSIIERAKPETLYFVNPRLATILQICRKDDNTVHKYSNTKSIHSYFAGLPEQGKRSEYILEGILNFIARYGNYAAAYS